MPNPYRLKGPDQFWRTGMATPPPGEIMPIRAKRFTLPPGTVLSTAGSCFAQNVALHLRANPAVRVLETEPVGPDQPRFSALYGNIYTVRQLVQLLDEAFGRRKPEAIVFRRGAPPMRCGRAIYFRRPELRDRIGTDRYRAAAE